MQWKLTQGQVETMRKMSASRQHTVAEICRVMGITKPTYYRYMEAGKWTALSYAGPGE